MAGHQPVRCPRFRLSALAKGGSIFINAWHLDSYFKYTRRLNTMSLSLTSRLMNGPIASDYHHTTEIEPRLTSAFLSSLNQLLIALELFLLLFSSSLSFSNENCDTSKTLARYARQDFETCPESESRQPRKSNFSKRNCHHCCQYILLLYIINSHFKFKKEKFHFHQRLFQNKYFYR